VSVKITPEICINNASSNSRLTAAGRWDTASDSHSQNGLQTFFFSLFLWFDNNRTTPACWKTNWNCIDLNLGHFVVGFCCCCFVLYCFGLVWFLVVSPLMRQWLNYFWDTISRTGVWGTNIKIIKTQTLLHLNLEIFFSFIFFQSSLCLSNACLAYCWLVHYLSLFISLKHFLFVLFFLLVCLFVFPFFFNFFAFHLLSPFHCKYHHCYYYKLENT
jgi:hypothetical protein